MGGYLLVSDVVENIGLKSHFTAMTRKYLCVINVLNIQTDAKTLDSIVAQ